VECTRRHATPEQRHDLAAILIAMYSKGGSMDSDVVETVTRRMSKAGK
jgi:hypothetical protein